MVAVRSLKNEAQQELKRLVNSACTDTTTNLPYSSVVVVGSGAGVLFAHTGESSARRHTGPYPTAGDTPDPDNNKVGDGGQGGEKKDDILWLASCTKLVTSVACLQLVERGELALDDADQVETLCPELRDVMVLEEDGSLVSKTRRITLRMLLTHTAGFGYSFLNPKLHRHRSQRSVGHTASYDEFSGVFEDILQPLVNQPGQMFEYGISSDWAGVLVERATGIKLDDYMQLHVFQPLKIRDLSMFPSLEMKQRLVGLWHRSADSTLSPREYPLSRPLLGEKLSDCFHSGGAGLFGSIREFSKILTALLNGGTSPATGASILSASSVSQLFTNQLTQWPNFARRYLPSLKPELVYPAEGLYPFCPPSLPQGFGLGAMVSPGITGRSDGTIHWTGLSNVFWWVDRENGVGGVVASQILPFVDPQAAMLWVQVEGKVYEGLQKIEE